MYGLMAFFQHLCVFLVFVSSITGIKFDPDAATKRETVCENKSNGSPMFTVKLQDATNPTLSVITSQYVAYFTTAKTSNLEFNVNTNQPLDRETLSNFDVVFEAFDLGDVSYKTYTISVDDQNDNNPVFDAPIYVADVYEYPWTPDYFLNVSATDADTGKAGSISSIAMDQLTSMLKVTYADQIGSVSTNTNSKLDFEQVPVLYETVVATDTSDSSCSTTNKILSSTASVIINILDGPDEPPFFTSARYEKEILENTPGEIGIQVEAKDGDTELQWEVEYNIVPKEGIEGVFEVNKTSGQISAIGKIDRESPVSLANGGIFMFQVVATEVEPPGHPFSKDVINFPLNATIDVTITVTDIEDNKPTFYLLESSSDTSTKVPQTNFTAEIEEESSKNIALPNLNIYVEDSDDIKNAYFDLSLASGGDVFTVSPTAVYGSASVTLAVKDSKFLNYNEEKNILVKIIATPLNGTESIQATVNVTILDVNNHSPVFERSNFNVSIPENSEIGTDILTIQATDDDSGINAELSYSLDDTSFFAVNAVTGQVTVNGSLDRETSSIYYVAATVTDIPGRRDVATIAITITDLNDETPIFQRTSYVATVAENSSDFSPAVFLDAIDNDQTGTNNSKISYSIIGGDLFDNFEIIQPSEGNTQGELVVKTPVDLESLDKSTVVCSGRGTGTIVLELMVSDYGTPDLNSTVNVTVSVEDINDHQPKFTQDVYESEIPEKSAAQYIVTTVHANDSDACEPNNKVNYQIGQGGNTTSSTAFSIDADEGIIKVIDSQLDRDVMDKYWIEVIAVDSGTNRLSATAMVVVTLLDINDKAPTLMCDSLTPANVTEDVANGTVVRIIEATDPDGNPDLTFSIKNVKCFDLDGKDQPGSCGSPFIIENNSTAQVGLLKVVGKLDRESLPLFEITVEVQDLNSNITSQVQTDTGIIEVVVDDINDNHPQFNPLPTFSVNEEEKGSFVGQVSCTDRDIGKNAEIVYSVGESSKYWIKVDPTSGIITTNNSFDRESQGNSINATIIASDRGEPSLNTTQQITIEIIDVNDHTPQFVTNVSTAELAVAENVINGTYLFQVNATDDDIGANAELSYILREGYTEFSIEENSGKIYTRKIFDAEVSLNYQLKVEVLDRGPSPRSSEIILPVNILDVDDEDPYYPKDENNSEENVVEEQDPGYVFTLPLASDDDVWPENRVNYYFIVGGTGSNFFHINSSSAAVSTTQKLDRETNDTYDLVVYVTSENSTSLADIQWENLDASFFHVVISVMDANDNSPTFSQKFYESDIAYDTEPSSETLFEVVASDPDLNSEFTYSITSSNFVNADGASTESMGTFGVQQSNNKGNIILSSPIPSDASGHYKLDLEVTDGVEGHIDSATATVRIVLATETVILYSGFTPTTFAEIQTDFINDLSALLNAQVIVDKVIPYTGTENGNFYNSEIYLHAIDYETGDLIPKEDIELKLNEPGSETFRSTYNIQGAGNAVVTSAPPAEQDYKIAILAVIVVLAVTVIVCIASFIYIHRRLKRRLRMHKAIEESHAAVLSAGNFESDDDEKPYNENPIFDHPDENTYMTIDNDGDNAENADGSNDSAVVADVQDSSFEAPDLDLGGINNASLLAALSAATQDFGEDNLASVFDNLDDTSF